MDNITKEIKDFYEKYNFPSRNQLEDFDVLTALIGKKETNFLKNKKILDAGCGTGEKSCFLASTGANVTAIDISKSSLKKARKFAEKNNIKNISFLYGNLMELSLRFNKFDYVICDGVLHHLSHPYLGFVSLSKKIKKGGYLILGLYNYYSSISIRLKRRLISLLGKTRKNKIKIANFLFNNKRLLSEQDKVWIADLYTNPHEKYLSFNQILKWFKFNNIDYISSFPPIEIDAYKDIFYNKYRYKMSLREAAIKTLMNRRSYKNNNKLLQNLIQLCWNLPGGKDYFYVCGRKR